MLIIKRKIGQRFYIQLEDGERVWVCIEDVAGRVASVSIQAPQRIRILREELIPRDEIESRT